MQCTRDMVSSGRASPGEAMVAARRVITLSIDPDQCCALANIARSRTEATGRVERARIILAYLETPSAYGVARQIGVSQQTVMRCLERAAELGVLAALDDRPRAGRDAVITREARAWLVSLACAKPVALGYPHELWTTRLLAAHARNHGPQAGHPSLAKLAQGTVCKILAAHEIKPHKIRYYAERRDPEFEPKMAGTVTIMAASICLPVLCTRSSRIAIAVASSSSSSKFSTRPTQPQRRSRSFWSITRRTSRGRPRPGWPLSRTAASPLSSPPNTVPGSTSSRGFSPKQRAPCSATSVSTRHTN